MHDTHTSTYSYSYDTDCCRSYVITKPTKIIRGKVRKLYYEEEEEEEEKETEEGQEIEKQEPRKDTNRAPEGSRLGSAWTKWLHTSAQPTTPLRRTHPGGRG